MMITPISSTFFDNSTIFVMTLVLRQNLSSLVYTLQEIEKYTKTSIDWRSEVNINENVSLRNHILQLKHFYEDLISRVICFEKIKRYLRENGNSGEKRELRKESIERDGYVVNGPKCIVSITLGHYRAQRPRTSCKWAVF